MFSPAQLDDIRERNPIPDVVAGYGVTLRRNAGVCLICGGSKGNARFEAKDGGRRWVCAACPDGGDVIKLVMKVEGINFLRAVERLGGVAKIDPEVVERLTRERAKRQARLGAEAEKYRQDERKQLYRRWCAARANPLDVVHDYLDLRRVRRHDGLNLRFEPAAAYCDGDFLDDFGRRSPRVLWRGPAMLAAIAGADGRFAGLHITWLDLSRPKGKAQIVDPESGETLPAKKMRGRKAGGYLAVARDSDPTLTFVGEGIESVLPLRDRYPAATFRIAGDLGNLAGQALDRLPHPYSKDAAGRPKRIPGVEPNLESAACPVPMACRDLVLLKDGDSDPFTTDCAMARAAARHRCPGRRISIADPGEGVDFNDLARAS